MLKGLAKAKALKELQVLLQQKASLKGLALAKALKRQNELRNDLGMGKWQQVAENKAPLNINDIQPLQIDDESKVKKAVEKYLSQFRDKYITTVDGKNVVFNGKGRNHLANDVVFGENIIASAIEKVVEVLTQGQFIEVQDLDKKRYDSFIAFHVYRKWVQVDNQELHLQVKVGQLKDGTFEVGNGLIAYSAKNAENEKAITPPTTLFDSVSINSGAYRFSDDSIMLDSASQEDYVFLEILEVRPYHNLDMGKKQDEQKVYVDTLVFNQNQEILLVQRHANDDFMPNKWWIAGGKLEQGETLEQGAKRELREETGIKVSDVTFVEKAKLQNGGISHRFAVVVDNDTPIHLQKDELQAYRWVKVDELGKFDLLGRREDLENLVSFAIDTLNLGITQPDLSILQVSDDPVEVVRHVYKNAQQQYAGKQPKAITVKSDGSVILLGWQGIKHALSKDSNKTIALATTCIEKLIENAVFLQELKNKPKGNKKGDENNKVYTKSTLLYKSALQEQNGIVDIGIIVKVLEDGSRMYDYFSLNIKKAPNGISGETNQPAVIRSDENILSRTENNVNSQEGLDDKTADIPQTAYQLHEKPTANNRQKDNDRAVALMRELQETGRKATSEEKAILSRYTGTGGNLVGDDGLQGSAYEYYTPIEVASSMWDLLKESGFTGGAVLDPSAGTGIFKASAPKDILMHSVELSDISGQINALVNDDETHKVTISPFEKIASSTEDETFEAVMTNVPFGNVSARGENRFFDRMYQDDSLEEYFIKRSLDKLKPNGLAMFIVPTKMLDGTNYKKFRQAVLLRADLLGAYRLPNKVFDATGADVTTDIIVLKKFSRDVKDKIDSLYQNGGLKTLQQAKVLDKDIIAGKYFSVYGRAFVLGEYQTGKGRYGDVVRVVNDDSLPNILKLVRKFGDSRIDYAMLDVANVDDEITLNDGDVRVIDGMTYEYHQGQWQMSAQQQTFDETPFVDYGSLIRNNIKLADIDRYKAYLVSVGRKTPDWLDVLISSSQDDNALYYWATLNAVAEALKVEKTQGYEPFYPELTKAMLNIAPSYAKNAYKTKNNSYKALYKAVAIAFNATGVSDYWRDGTGVELQSNALNHQQAYDNAVYRGLAENWQVDIDLIKQSNPDFNPLADDDFCINADGTKVTLARDYYVGNYAEFLAKIDDDIAQATDPQVKEKLLKQKAKAESMIDYTNVSAMNFSLLSTVIPIELKYRFFNEFVDSATILIDHDTEDKKLLKLDAKDITSFSNIEDLPEHNIEMRRYLLNRVFISISNGQALNIDKRSIKDSEQYGILTKKLNKYFRELNINFNAWLKTQKTYMAKLEYQFNAPENKQFSTIADGSAFDIDNFNPKYDGFKQLHDYQFEEVRRLSRSFSGGCGFDVGLGKTATALATIQNMHNIGVKKRTIIVVPNHTISKWAKDVNNVYDDTTDVLVIGSNQNQNDSADSKHYASDFALLTTEKGHQYRKILMTVEAFTQIPMREKYIHEYFGQGDETVKRAEVEKEKGDLASIGKKLNQYEGKIAYFEDMQIDSMVFDEAQLFKNGLDGGDSFDRIKGLSSKKLNQLATRALSARVKSWFVRGRNKAQYGLDDGVVLLTATPFTNSPIEVMTMLSLAIGDEKIKKLFAGTAMRNVDDFLSTFASIDSIEQQNILGETVSLDTFVGFQNVDLLKKVIHQVVNIQNAKDRGLKIPEEDHVTSRVTLPDNDIAQLQKMKLFYKIAKAMSKNEIGKATEAEKAFLSALPEQILAEYLDYREQVKEPDSTIGHAFSLINRMSELTLVGADMALNRHVVLDFDPKQVDIAKKVAQEFNTSKKPKPEFTTTRNYPLDDEFVTTITKTDKNTGEEKLEYKIKAQVTAEKSRLILNVDDSTMLANLMALVQKHGLNIRPKLSAKVQALIDNVKLELSTPKYQGFAKQLIFCDVLSMHHIIKQALIGECGIPSSQIAILNAQTMPNGTAGSPDTEAVQEIQDLFADNTYTIVIANKKAETGIDLQKGTQAIHHLTTGWTPDSLQQRNGRGVRQGNTQDKVTIYAYNANGTFDEYKRTLIENKSDWIDSLMDKNTEVTGTLVVSQELSEQDYEDLIEADSAEKIAEIIKQKAEREAKERQERTQAKNTFIFNNMTKAKQQARDTDFNQLAMRNMVADLNVMVDLVRSNAGGAEAKQKRVEKAKIMLNQYAGLLNNGVDKLWEMVEHTAQNKKNSYNGTIKESDIKYQFFNDNVLFGEFKANRTDIHTNQYWSLTAELQEEFNQYVSQVKDDFFSAETLAFNRVRNIISSRLEMLETTKQEFLNNDDSEYSRDERQAIIENRAVVYRDELVYHGDLMKYNIGNDSYYAIAEVKNDGSVKFHRKFNGDYQYKKVAENERQQAIEYMVELDFERAKANGMKMSDDLQFSALLTEVYNAVQARINDSMDDYMNEEIALKLEFLLDKSTGRLHGLRDWWSIFAKTENNEDIQYTYYQPFRDLKDNDSQVFVFRKDLQRFGEDRQAIYHFYGQHLKPFLIANSFKVDLSLDFNQSRYYNYFINDLFESFSTFSTLNELGIEQSAWSNPERYQQVMKQVANYIFGHVVANIDELVEKLGLALFNKTVQNAIKAHIGELSENGEDPEIMKRNNMLELAKAYARENPRGVEMVALKDSGSNLYNNKEKLKKIAKHYSWNREQSAWYVGLSDLPALMDTSWFDWDNFSVHIPQKYA